MNNTLVRYGTIIGAILLIAGTCMGGGMFAMPIIVGLGGFFPGMLMTVIVWLCNFCTALLFVEATLGLPDGANVLSMLEKYFGRWGKFALGIPYALFNFIVVTSYPALALPILMELTGGKGLLESSTGFGAYFIFGVIAGAIIFAGVKTTKWINALLMMGFFILFTWLVIRGSSFVSSSHTFRSDWTFMFLAGPILFTAFCFHNLIPTLVTLLKRDVKDIKISIFSGFFLSLVVYLIWEWVTIGSLSQGVIWESFERGALLSTILQMFEGISWLGTLNLIFAVFALVTSLLGVALGFIDFLCDGFQWTLSQRIGIRRLIACLILFIPLILLSAFFHNFFFQILGYGGGFGFVIFNGIFPILLAWKARYGSDIHVPFLLPGGRIVLGILFFVVFYILYLQGILLVH